LARENLGPCRGGWVSQEFDGGGQEGQHGQATEVGGSSWSICVRGRPHRAIPPPPAADIPGRTGAARFDAPAIAEKNRGVSPAAFRNRRKRGGTPVVLAPTPARRLGDFGNRPVVRILATGARPAGRGRCSWWSRLRRGRGGRPRAESAPASRPHGRIALVLRQASRLPRPCADRRWCQFGLLSAAVCRVVSC